MSKLIEELLNALTNLAVEVTELVIDIRAERNKI